jgi:hypothetical protein
MHAQEMIATHPQVRGQANSRLIDCIEACLDCAQTCTSCADACTAEPTVAELAQCIRLNHDCADLCAATAMVASRRTGGNELVMRMLIETCVTACRVCAEECERHAAHMQHCAVCAEACRRCEAACRDAAQSITPSVQ